MTSSLQNAFSPLYLTWVYWVLWVWSSLPLEGKDETQRGRHTVTGGALSAQLPSHPYPKLPHWRTSAQSGSHSHTVSHLFHSPCSRFPEEHSQPTSSSTHTKLSSHKLHVHSSHGTGTEGAHGGQTTRDRSPAPYPEPLPDGSQLGAHARQCPSHAVNTLASILLHPQPLLKGLITPMSSLLLAPACWVHSILLQLNQSPPP